MELRDKKRFINDSKFGKDPLQRYEYGLVGGISAALNGIMSLANSQNLAHRTPENIAADAPVIQKSVMGQPYVAHGSVGNSYSQSIKARRFGDALQAGTQFALAGGALGQYIKDNRLKNQSDTSDSMISNEYKCGKLPKYFAGLASAALGLGGAVASLFANKNQVDAAEQQEREANLINSKLDFMSNTIAKDKGIRQQYIANNGDMRAQSLTKFRDGLPINRVQSAFGKVFQKANGLGQEGELMGVIDDNGNVISQHLIQTGNKKPKYSKGKEPGDTVPIYTTPNTFILPRDITRYYLSTDDLQGALAMTQARQQKHSEKGLPKHINGLPSLAVNGGSMLMNLFNYINTKNEPVDTSRSNFRNVAASHAIPAMFGVRDSINPAINHALSNQVKGNRLADISSGLNTGQKQLVRMQANSNALNNAYNEIANINARNNQYRMSALNSELTEGRYAADSVARNYQFDKEFNARSNSAANNIARSYLVDSVKAAQQLAADYTKLGQFKDMYKLYASQNELEREKINILKNQVAAQIDALGFDIRPQYGMMPGTGSIIPLRWFYKNK